MAMDASRWNISLLEHDLLVESWCHQDQELSPSFENEYSGGEPQLTRDRSCLKKRVRSEECPGGVLAKACREKMRRDRLNDRFVELSAVLEPNKPPKTDKASILGDATRILSQLRVETQYLKDANRQLQETIKELKVEKNELRDEKLILKFEKEKLEKQFKLMNVGPGYLSQPSTIHPTTIATFSPPPDISYSSKPDLYVEVPLSIAMSQWMPQATMDISNDHVLRPPVA